jgi:hypothetical protein
MIKNNNNWISKPQWIRNCVAPKQILKLKNLYIIKLKKIKIIWNLRKFNVNNKIL